MLETGSKGGSLSLEHERHVWMQRRTGRLDHGGGQLFQTLIQRHKFAFPSLRPIAFSECVHDLFLTAFDAGKLRSPAALSDLLLFLLAQRCRWDCGFGMILTLPSASF